MLVLVTGGAASGKSEFCEDLAVKLGNKKLYIATMLPYGSEAQKRIERHVKMRRDKGFDSIDCYTNIGSIKNIGGYDLVMVECMSNLTANEMFEKGGNVGRIAGGIANLQKEFENVFIVSNDVFEGGDNYSEETIEYIRNIGRVNIELAKTADCVVEVVSSIPIVLKGRELIEKFI